MNVPRQICSAVNNKMDTNLSGIPNLLISGMLAASLAFGAIQPSAVLALESNMAQKAVAEYNILEEKGISEKSIKQLEDLRQRYKIRRSADGRLQLRSSRGEWYQCRLDMEVAGSMLLRDPKGGVYAIQTDSLQQASTSFHAGSSLTYTCQMFAAPGLCHFHLHFSHRPHNRGMHVHADRPVR